MCDSINRRGRLCSECIEGFGPSIISSGLVYMYQLYRPVLGMEYHSTNNKFLEFAFLFFFSYYFNKLAILFFRVNITSASMVAFDLLYVLT